MPSSMKPLVTRKLLETHSPFVHLNRCKPVFYSTLPSLRNSLSPFFTACNYDTFTVLYTKKRVFSNPSYYNVWHIMLHLYPFSLTNEILITYITNKDGFAAKYISISDFYNCLVYTLPFSSTGPEWKKIFQISGDKIVDKLFLIKTAVVSWLTDKIYHSLVSPWCIIRICCKLFIFIIFFTLLSQKVSDSILHIYMRKRNIQ